jgi:hypothetical protein
MKVNVVDEAVLEVEEEEEDAAAGSFKST